MEKENEDALKKYINQQLRTDIIGRAMKIFEESFRKKQESEIAKIFWGSATDFPNYFYFYSNSKTYSTKYKINMSHTPSAISHPKFKIGDRVRVDKDERTYITFGQNKTGTEGNITHIIESREKLLRIFPSDKDIYEYHIDKLPCYFVKCDGNNINSAIPENNLSLVERKVDGVENPEPECHCKSLLWGHENSCPHYRK